MNDLQKGMLNWHPVTEPFGTPWKVLESFEVELEKEQIPKSSAK